MVIMAGAVFYVLRLGLAVFPSIALRYPIKKWAAVGAILGAFGYLMISGAAFATVRSYVMITIMFLAVLLDRPAIALRNVALAALAILVVYPESLLDAGFQMSFAAVTGLVSAYEWLRRRREARGNAGAEEAGPVRRAGRFVGEIVLSTVIASAVVAPFGIYHFHNTQLLALVGNVLAIPICNLIVMPAALAVLLLLPVGFEWLALAVMGFGIDLMTAVARWVGAMPGAVAKVPAIPTSAFAAMVTGGLWLLLWQRAWRIAGLVPIAIGILLAPTLNRPDVLIGRDGSTVAVRGADGRLAALAGRATSFEVARWLELDGDRRPAVEVIATTAPAFSCDGVGCLATTSGKRVAIATTPAALRDDCPMADVVVLRFASGPKCGTDMRATQVVLEPSDLARRGAHAIYVTKTGLRIETVADARGQRPWSGALVPQEASEIIP
jgi:competence protein ComEC